MLRSLPRAANSSLYLRPCLRTTKGPSKPPASICTSTTHQQQSRSASSSHAISNPTLAGIEKRWEVMPPQEQADLWMALRDRMKIDWHDLTMQEKKAGEFWLLYIEKLVERWPKYGMAWLVSCVMNVGLRHSMAAGTTSAYPRYAFGADNTSSQHTGSHSAPTALGPSLHLARAR